MGMGAEVPVIENTPIPVFTDTVTNSPHSYISKQPLSTMQLTSADAKHR